MRSVYVSVCEFAIQFLLRIAVTREVISIYRIGEKWVFFFPLIEILERTFENAKTSLTERHLYHCLH